MITNSPCRSVLKLKLKVLKLVLNTSFLSVSAPSFAATKQSLDFTAIEESHWWNKKEINVSNWTVGFLKMHTNAGNTLSLGLRFRKIKSPHSESKMHIGLMGQIFTIIKIGRNFYHI